MKRRIEDRLEELSRKFGYAPYKMSRFEEYELYVRNKDFLQSDRVITFSGKDGRLLAMKPDVTLSIVKNAPQAPGQVRKVHYRENVYRMDRDTGNFREILQAGIECVGDVGFYEAAEVVFLAARSLEALFATRRFDAPNIPVYMNVDAAANTDAAAIPALLVRQAMSPVRWMQTLLNMQADGFDTFIECGPGKTLTGLASRTLKDATILRVGDAQSLRETLEALGK
jgi:histidyl-tRNA synthetase